MLHGKICKKIMVNNDISFILLFVILIKNVDFWVLPLGVPDGTV